MILNLDSSLYPTYRILPKYPIELVRKLRDSSKFAHTDTVEEFMSGFAKRMKDYSGDDISADSPENFIGDLLRIKFLTLMV